MYNPYGQLTTEALVKAIQRTELMLRKHEAKKEIPSTKLNRIRKELAEMRAAVFYPLKELDRMDPQFFKVGYHVEFYVPPIPTDVDDWGPDTTIPPRAGVVTRYIEDKVVVQLEGDDYEVMIEPRYLKIKFIRP